MPGPSGGASSSKPTSSSRAPGTGSHNPKSNLGAKRPRLQSVSEDEGGDRTEQTTRPARAAVGKGKAKADPIALEEDEEEGATEAPEDGEPDGSTLEDTRTNKNTQDTSRINGRGGDSIVSLQRHLRELKAKLAETEKSRDTYRTQLQKLHQLRYTDPEKNMQDLEKIWEERSKLQQDQITELRRYAGLLSKDEDAPQQRIAALEGENTRIKAELGRARQLLNEAERSKGRESSLEEEVRQLRVELDAEIARNQTSRTVTKVTANPKLNPSTAKIIKLYEEVTNMTVTDHKTERAENGLGDSDVYSCIVTVKERSVGFKLNIHAEPGEQVSPGRSTTTHHIVSYTPTTLEQETDQDLLESLDFLCGSFDFDQSQSDTFLRTLIDRLKGV